MSFVEKSFRIRGLWTQLTGYEVFIAIKYLSTKIRGKSLLLLDLEDLFNSLLYSYRHRHRLDVSPYRIGD